MKCRVCRGPAIIDIRRYNANFCSEHFLKLCRDQTAKAITQFDMLQPDDRVLVAVSVGKDSLAGWDILNELGYDAEGFYVGPGIGDYSDVSAEDAVRFAREQSLTLLAQDLLREYGFDVPHGSRAAKQAPCSACGLTKRHLFDEAARRGGYDAIVTGHNLDDEAAVLMGDVLHWHIDYLARQAPTLAARDGFPKKAKPLVRLTERETAANCVARGIEYLVDERPMATGKSDSPIKSNSTNSNELRRVPSSTFTSASCSMRRIASQGPSPSALTSRSSRANGVAPPPTTTSARSAPSPNEPSDPSRSRSGANPRRSPHEP